MALRGPIDAESGTEYNTAIEHEYREAEYKYKYDEGREPEPGRVPKDGLRGFTNGKTIVRPK